MTFKSTRAKNLTFSSLSYGKEPKRRKTTENNKNQVADINIMKIFSVKNSVD